MRSATDTIFSRRVGESSSEAATKSRELNLQRSYTTFCYAQFSPSGSPEPLERAPLDRAAAKSRSRLNATQPCGASPQCLAVDTNAETDAKGLQQGTTSIQGKFSPIISSQIGYIKPLTTHYALDYKYSHNQLKPGTRCLHTSS